ncbi:MAG: cytosine deaminase [Christensenellaceae bacterium]|jgi:cytosine deaminase|nr:cytosine deaminase [Christensenellaceae bacterium]
MLLKNIRIENAAQATDIRITGQTFASIAPNLMAQPGEQVLDCEGKMALPPFVESHIHLDTCLTLPQVGVNKSGTLFEGIQLWSKYRQGITREELRNRALRTIRLYAAHGVQYIRSHVDITGGLTTMETLLELKDEVKDLVELQLVAFPQDGILSSPGAKSRMEAALEMGADVIGGIPHFEFTREYGVESMKYVIELAERTGKLVDVHCDEIDDEQSRFVESLATFAYAAGLGGRVTASHTTAMHSYNSAYCSKLFRLLGLSGIHFVSNPLVNIHLQGRFDTYPKRRGLTRVKELLEAGMNVSFGHDDMSDPYYPLGNGNMLDVLLMGLHVCQMLGYDELMNAYRIVTHNGAKTLHLGEDYGICAGNTANLVVLNAPDFLTALREHAGVVYSVRQGKLIKG